MASLNALPSKLLLRIFGLLDLNDLVSVARASKKFKTIADDPSLYRCLRVNRRHRLDDVVSVLRRQRNAVEACKMEDVADSNTLLRHVARCPNLRKLKLVECDGERGIKESAFHALFAGTSIREFALKNCELERFPKLNLRRATSLVVVDNTGYHRRPLQYVAELLPAIERIQDTVESLKLCIDNVSPADQNRLFDRIEKCGRLRVLRFQYPHVDELSERNFRKLFSLRNLSSLSAVVSAAADDGAAYRQFMARPCVAHLRKIELAGEISGLLPAILRTCPNVEILRLTCLSRPFLRVGGDDLLAMLSTGRQLRDVSLKSISAKNLRPAVLQLPSRLPRLEHFEIEVDGRDDDDDGRDKDNNDDDDDGVECSESKRRAADTPLKIEFNLLPNFALETQNFETSTVYVLFRSEELLKFITSGLVF